MWLHKHTEFSNFPGYFVWALATCIVSGEGFVLMSFRCITRLGACGYGFGKWFRVCRQEGEGWRVFGVGDVILYLQ